MMKEFSGAKYRRPDRRTFPLRKVVGFCDGREVLECGHMMFPRSDAFGTTTAARRRCWKCHRGMKADKPSDDTKEGA